MPYRTVAARVRPRPRRATRRTVRLDTVTVPVETDSALAGISGHWQGHDRPSHQIADPPPCRRRRRAAHAVRSRPGQHRDYHHHHHHAQMMIEAAEPRVTVERR